MVTGILFLHGFSGGPYEVMPFADYIKKHTDWIVEVPTLSGHGDPESLHMAGYTAQDWLRDAEISFKLLTQKVDRVFVVGFSMGGVLALHLASKFKVEKLVLLSAAMKYIALPQLMKDIFAIANSALKKTLADNELFQRYSFKIKNVPIKSTFEFMKVVKTVKKVLPQITTPTMIVQGAEDGIVPASTAFSLFHELQATDKWLYVSESGKHHICYSEDCKRWFEKIYKLLVQ